MPGGAIQSQMVWVDADDDHLIVNTVITHQKFRNVGRDPHITLTLVDPATPSRYAEVRGRVVETIIGAEAWPTWTRSRRSTPAKPYEREVTADRVMLKIAPDRQRTFGGGRPQQGASAS